MITLTEAAAKQIQLSADQGQMKDMPLRLAAKRNPDQSLHYAMGFDDVPVRTTIIATRKVSILW